MDKQTKWTPVPYKIPPVPRDIATPQRRCSSTILDGERCPELATHVSFGIDPESSKKQNAHSYDCCADCAECEVANYSLPVVVSPFLRRLSVWERARALLARLGGAK